MPGSVVTHAPDVLNKVQQLMELKARLDPILSELEGIVAAQHAAALALDASAAKK